MEHLLDEVLLDELAHGVVPDNDELVRCGRSRGQGASSRPRGASRLLSATKLAGVSVDAEVRGARIGAAGGVKGDVPDFAKIADERAAARR
jgi:hypothetical protein